MLRSIVGLVMVLVFSTAALAVPPGSGTPPSALYDADNNGVVDGWVDLFHVYYAIGTSDLDSDVDVDGDVDWDDVYALSDYTILYDTDYDWLITSNDAQKIIDFINAGGTMNPEYDINGDQYVSAIDALWIINSLNKSPWRNPDNYLDVNDDGYVSAIDALQIINFNNANGQGPLAGRASKCRKPFYDVNGDKSITDDDAIQVINYLNGY